jgi:hypothetical protein
MIMLVMLGLSISFSLRTVDVHGARVRTSIHRTKNGIFSICRGRMSRASRTSSVIILQFVVYGLLYSDFQPTLFFFNLLTMMINNKTLF